MGTDELKEKPNREQICWNRSRQWHRSLCHVAYLLPGVVIVLLTALNEAGMKSAAEWGTFGAGVTGVQGPKR